MTRRSSFTLKLPPRSWKLLGKLGDGHQLGHQSMKMLRMKKTAADSRIGARPLHAMPWTLCLCRDQRWLGASCTCCTQPLTCFNPGKDVEEMDEDNVSESKSTGVSDKEAEPSTTEVQILVCSLVLQTDTVCAGTGTRPTSPSEE